MLLSLIYKLLVFHNKFDAWKITFIYFFFLAQVLLYEPIQTSVDLSRFYTC